MSENEKQVGGNHYKNAQNFEHWDMVLLFHLDYFQGQITKYVMRWDKKNGVEDLKKAAHFLAKYIEAIEAAEAAEAAKPQSEGYVNQEAYTFDITNTLIPGQLNYRCVVCGKVQVGSSLRTAFTDAERLWHINKGCRV